MENTGGFGFTGHVYDISDRLTETYVMDDTGGLESDIIYTYNDYGDMTSALKDGETGTRGDREIVSSKEWDYDILGNVISESASYGEDETGMQADHSYDSRGNLVKTSYSDETGLGDITYVYDLYGNLQKIKKDGKTAAEYTYDSGYRQLKEKVYAEPGSSSYTLKTTGYDAFGRTDAISYTKNGTDLLESYAYVYDENGNITERTRINPQADINETRAYTYSDFYDRLVQTVTTEGGSSKTTSYAYDAAGNRIFMSENGSTTTYTYNGLNQLKKKTDAAGTTTYTYDSRGNQISENSVSGELEFEYFISGELKKVKKNNTTIQENKYDHEGIRISREENYETRNYYYVNGSLVCTADNGQTSSSNLTDPYGSIMSTYRGTSGQNAYTYLTDIQGSTGSLMDESGTAEAVYTYSDFGEVTENITPDIDNEICYTGAVYDDTTGLHYMNARYYDPANGRFISQDSYRGSLDNYVQWHLYAYCANNPINYVDPSGHLATSTVAIFIDLGIGLISCGTSFGVQTALKTLKNEVLGKDLKRITQKVASNKYKIRTEIKRLYRKFVSSKKVTNALRKVKNGPLWDYKMFRNSNNYVNVIEGSIKEAAIGKLIDKLVGQFKEAGPYLTITAFSSIGNLIAALGEIAYDNKYNGEYKR